MSASVSVRVLALVLGGCFLSGPVQAKTSSWGGDTQARGRILSAVDSVGDHPVFEGVVEVEMGPGWHSYWKAPGDAGLAPVFDWGKSENIEQIEMFWPLPKRKEEAGFQVFGYEEHVRFPFRVEVKETGAPVTLAGRLQIMVCKEICIPQTLEMDLDLEAGDGGQAVESRVVDLAKSRLPLQGDAETLGIQTVVLGPDALVITARSTDGFDGVDVFAHAGERAFTALPQINVDEADAHKAMIVIAKPEDVESLQGFLEGQRLSVTLSNGREGVEKSFNF